MNFKKNKKQLNKSQSIRTIILERLASLTAKIALKYNIHHHEFYELFKRALVKQEKLSNKNSSIVEIACRTGIDRRYIKNYLHETKTISKIPKLKLILNEIKNLCNKNNTKFIKKHGYFQSFESICNQLASGSLTHNAIAKEFIRKGNLLDRGDSYELILWSYLPSKNEDDHAINILTTEIERLTDTFIYNFEVGDITDTQFQRNIFTTQIPPAKFTEVKLQLSDILTKTIGDVDQVILEYEEKVASGTYPTFGASMFVFGYENSNKE